MAADFLITGNGTPGLVSVTIPAYCAERFIGEALASVAYQTYPYWEVIVVEDGSTGPTRAIVEEFARQHPFHRVEYSRCDPNHGTGVTRNFTFARAQGEFIAILDADDRWFPSYLTASVQALQASGKDIAYSSTVMIDDQSELLLGIWGPTSNDLLDFPQSLFGRCFLTPSATLMRRGVLGDVGPWTMDLRYCDDFGYWLRCVAAGKQFQHVGGCHCLYRKNHSEATTRRLCGALEEVATVAARNVDMPGMRPKTCRKYASNSYVLAAFMHATTNPQHDPSADRFRAAQLMYQAWRFWPRRIDYLLKSGALRVVNLFRRRRHPVPTAADARQSQPRVAA
jgi:glycosyltransferase involved in cell wall biosynthesis